MTHRTAVATHRILVVDDNPDTAQSLALLLKPRGYSVQIATDGHQALDLIGAEEPDIVLLDLGMPIMDGYELAKRLHDRFPGTRPALVAVTGHGQPRDRQRCREAGIDFHLLKPVNPDRLIQLLDSIESFRRSHKPSDSQAGVDPED